MNSASRVSASEMWQIVLTQRLLILGMLHIGW